MEWPAWRGNSVDLNGDSPGTITQTFSVDPGTYTVGFYLSGNPDGNPSIKQLDASVQSLSGGTFSYTATINSNHNLNYEFHSFDFTTATGGSFNLIFSSDIAGAYGPVIGDVTVSSAVPEPSTWAMMVIGFLGVGFIAYRRKHTGLSFA